MFQNNLSIYQTTRLPGSGSAASIYARQYNTALNRFNATHRKGKFARLILIRVDDAYFVRDGHHRISVSRAFEQLAMDAEVITWKALPPFSWQPAR